MNPRVKTFLYIVLLAVLSCAYALFSLFKLCNP